MPHVSESGGPPPAAPAAGTAGRVKLREKALDLRIDSAMSHHLMRFRGDSTSISRRYTCRSESTSIRSNKTMLKTHSLRPKDQRQDRSLTTCGGREVRMSVQAGPGAHAVPSSIQSKPSHARTNAVIEAGGKDPRPAFRLPFSVATAAPRLPRPARGSRHHRTSEPDDNLRCPIPIPRDDTARSKPGSSTRNPPLMPGQLRRPRFSDLAVDEIQYPVPDVVQASAVPEGDTHGPTNSDYSAADRLARASGPAIGANSCHPWNWTYSG